VLKDGHIYPLQPAYNDHRHLLAAYFADRAGFMAGVSDSAIDMATVAFNAPLSGNLQLYCQGLNYADHRAESGASEEGDSENLVFMKAASSICGPNDTVLRPRDCHLLDYEIELGLVLKSDISAPASISEAALQDYVGALVLCNDVSARDLMFGAPMLQWFKGKSQRTFCPTGPVLYLMDEADFEHLYSLELTLSLNGEVKQHASTSQLIHKPAATLSEISQYANLAAGDCLLTGTPGGVLAGANFKVAMAILLNFQNDARRREKFTRAQLARTRFLQPGDQLDLSIRTPDGVIDLGRQHNQIADA
jgi:2-keto-4-pentenoate hydratase/2-oxohepta-3-ene-1,7-dioic acid hydratase in catechol pathway